MNKIKRLIILVIGVLLVSKAHSQALYCSSNGTHLLYINGVLTPEKTAIETRDLIHTILVKDKSIPPRIDKSS